MSKYFLIFFMLLGAADFGYGLWSGDRISLLIGGIMIFIGFSIMKKDREKAKKDASEEKPPNKG